MDEQEPPADLVVIGCSVLRAEVEALCRAHWPGLRLVFLPSMMHMHPDRLGSSLENVLTRERQRADRVMLIYGDCCPRMAALEALPGVTRTLAKNCFELLLGPEEYRRLSREGAFFLMPEWTRRWREIFTDDLGLDRDNATSFMQDMHRSLLYLDTGIAAVPDADLRACAEYVGLRCDVRTVSLEPLRSAIEDALRGRGPAGD